MTRQNSFSSVGNNQSNLEEIWADLRKGITEIYAKECNIEYALYTYAHNYYTSVNASTSNRDQTSIKARARNNPHAPIGGAQLVGHELYKRLKQFVEDYLTDLLKKRDNRVSEELLMFYTQEWEAYQFSSRVLHGICAYLNRHWVKRECEEGREDIYEIYQLALVTWRGRLVKDLTEQMKKAVLELIAKEHNGGPISSRLVPGVINYVGLGVGDEDQASNDQHLNVYNESFENQFLNYIETFYATESSEFLRDNTGAEYMNRVERRLKEEQKSVQTYLHESTSNRLARTNINEKNTCHLVP